MKKGYVLDVVKIVFQTDPAAAGLFFILRLLQALTPILQTLARILLGLYPPKSGSVFQGGERIDENTCCFSSVSAVFQSFNRYPLSLEENIRISDLNSRESW